MGSIGVTEVVLVILVIIIFFGAKKIPEIAKGLAQGIRELRKTMRDGQAENENETKNLDEKNEPKP